MSAHRPPTAHRALRRRLPVVAFIVFVVLYAGLIVLYAVSGGVQGVSAVAPDGGVRVVITADDVDAQGQRFLVDIDLDFDDSLGEEGRFTLARPLTVVIDPSAGSRQVSYPAGQIPGVTEVELLLEGDIRSWPFDAYDTRFVVGVYDGTPEDGQLLETSFSFDGNVRGWRLVAESLTDPSGSAQESQFAYGHVHLRRSGDTLVFAGILLGTLVALPLLALFVAGQTAAGRRPVQPTFMSWMAAMLFATIPIRNFLPGSPPAGAWVDAVIVLWVVVALVASLALYVAAWWRQGHPSV